MYVFECFQCRAAERRLQTGSDNPYEKTAASSTDAAIAPANKGFKMLAKMGWSQGQGLGSEGNQGRTEPVPMTTNVERAGILHTVTFICFFVFSVQEGIVKFFKVATLFNNRFNKSVKNYEKRHLKDLTIPQLSNL